MLSKNADLRREALTSADTATDIGSSSYAQTVATIYVGDQLKRIADVYEESAKMGGIMHALPTTMLEVVRALDRLNARTGL
jgi:hypothetical protein